jgi:hypothetical protein
MPSIFDMFASQVGDGQLDQIAKQLGADKAQTRDAISMTLPALIEALGRKAEEAGGAEDLHSKLGQASQANRGNAGSMLDQLNDILGQSSPPAGRSAPELQQQQRPSNDDILPPTSAPTSRTTSNPPAQRQPAPKAPSSLPDIFGELLGNKQGKVSDAVSKTSGLNKEQAGSLISILGPILSGMLGSQAAEKKMSPTDLTEMLRQDRAKVQQAPGGTLVGKMLDQDGDGDFDMSDMMKLGMGMLFNKK